MGTNTILDDIPTCSVLDFPWQIFPSNEKGVGNLQRVRHLGGFRWAGFIDELESVSLIFLGFINFHFPIDFIGGQCFVETHFKQVHEFIATRLTAQLRS